MHKQYFSVLTVSSLLLGGCVSTGTLSFSTPRVRADVHLEDDGECKGKIHPWYNPYPRTEQSVKSDDVINYGVSGALKLIDNYRITYQCAVRGLSNGRQLFEVPAALSLAGGATATALGAGPVVAIATGAGSATLSHGNSYYAPQMKAHIVNAAYSAVVCIQQEASGISTQAAISAAASVTGSDVNDAKVASSPNASITFKPQLQYYQMVSSALQQVDAILSDRLSTVGSYSASSIADDIRTLTKQVQDANAVKADPANATNPQAVQVQASATAIVAPAGTTPPAAGSPQAAQHAIAQSAVVNSILELNVLQPRLQICVQNAKAG